MVLEGLKVSFSSMFPMLRKDLSARLAIIELRISLNCFSATSLSALYPPIPLGSNACPVYELDISCSFSVVYPEYQTMHTCSPSTKWRTLYLSPWSESPVALEESAILRYQSRISRATSQTYLIRLDALLLRLSSRPPLGLPELDAVFHLLVSPCERGVCNRY